MCVIYLNAYIVYHSIIAYNAFKIGVYAMVILIVIQKKFIMNILWYNYKLVKVNLTLLLIINIMDVIKDCNAHKN